MGCLTTTISHRSILEAHEATCSCSNEDEPEEREPYMTHGMMLAEQSIDELNARDDFEGLNDY